MKTQPLFISAFAALVLGLTAQAQSTAQPPSSGVKPSDDTRKVENKSDKERPTNPGDSNYVPKDTNTTPSNTNTPATGNKPADPPKKVEPQPPIEGNKDNPSAKDYAPGRSTNPPPGEGGVIPGQAKKDETNNPNATDTSRAAERDKSAEAREAGARNQPSNAQPQKRENDGKDINKPVEERPRDPQR